MRALVLLFFIGAVSVLLSFVGSAAALDDAPVVNTTSGPVRGFYQTEEGNLTRAFRGVPFADPPERFAVATTPTPWTEIKNTTSFPAPCMQPGVATASEDCLYLNVFTPKDAQAGDNLPVMVYVHGGRYWTGESDQYAGQWLSGSGQVVLVTIQVPHDHMCWQRNKALPAACFILDILAPT
jgi:para-nitrobenzyl esterase